MCSGKYGIKFREMRETANAPATRKRAGITACVTSAAKCEKCGVLSCARWFRRRAGRFILERFICLYIEKRPHYRRALDAHSARVARVEARERSLRFFWLTRILVDRYGSLSRSRRIFMSDSDSWYFNRDCSLRRYVGLARGCRTRTLANINIWIHKHRQVS